MQSQNESINHAALLEQSGAIIESGQGNLGHLIIGGRTIVNGAAHRFQQLNVLYVLRSCCVQAHHFRESPDEAFLKTQKRPVVRALSEPETEFRKDLFSGKLSGKAFYDNCHGFACKSQHLFDDSVLIIFGGYICRVKHICPLTQA